MPVTLQDLTRQPLHPKDPLPIPTKKARWLTVSAVTKFANEVKDTLTPLDVYLPRSTFPETGKLLRHARPHAEAIAEHFYVIVVGKGSRELWSFCKWWLWGSVEEVFREEGYINVQTKTFRVK